MRIWRCVVFSLRSYNFGLLFCARFCIHSRQTRRAPSVLLQLPSGLPPATAHVLFFVSRSCLPFSLRQLQPSIFVAYSSLFAFAHSGECSHTVYVYVTALPNDTRWCVSLQRKEEEEEEEEINAYLFVRFR